MKPLRLSIRTSIPIQDGYLYGGNLFLIFKDGTLRTIPIDRILDKYFAKDIEMHHFYKMAFSRNNWFTNEQADTLFSLNNLRTAFFNTWSQYKDIQIDENFSESEFNTLFDLPKMPIFDLKLYGMRLFVGNRDGLYDAGINIDSYSSNVSVKDSLERVFDARTTFLSSKLDSLLVSSNSDGLFHGRLIDINRRLSLNNKAIRPNSLRTGWNGFNVVNYFAQSHFDLLMTEREQGKERTYQYSAGDEDSRKIKITSIGNESLDMDQVLTSHTDLIDNIKYVFNAPQSCYFFLKNGQFLNIFFNRQANTFKLSGKVREVWQTDSSSHSSKIISANTIKDGCVLEYDDSVVLVKDQQETLLKTGPVFSVRTYPTSIRYRNIISIVDRDGIDLFSVYPSIYPVNAITNIKNIDMNKLPF